MLGLQERGRPAEGCWSPAQVEQGPQQHAPGARDLGDCPGLGPGTSQPGLPFVSHKSPWLQGCYPEMPNAETCEDRPDLPWAKEAQPRKTAPLPPPQNVLAALTLTGGGLEAARGLERAVWECAPVPSSTTPHIIH